ncbi:MAG TPA: cytochrome c oxidase subunit II, partial [Planctomycetaceae bacterium]|nr:cytochrome c oxidase subunit II [Planctomycetaceae bacterium]
MRWFWIIFFMFWPAVGILACFFAPEMNWWFPGESGSPLGKQIDDLFYLILWIVTAVFIGVQIALGYVLWKNSQPDQEKAEFTHGSHHLEVIWTIVPAGILLFIALYQMEVWAQYRVVSNFPEAAMKAPVAEVTARQFEWRIRYPEPGRTLKTSPEKHDLYSVNELLVPAGRPVMIYLRTEDVQHSFFVPRLRVKQDAVPGQIIPVWFEVIEPGEYELLCAELCGWGHYKMKARVVALPEHEYEAAIEALEKEQAFDGTAPEGDSEDE